LHAEGYLARAVHGERLTLAVVDVEPGAELPEHQHDNEQFGIVIERRLSFESETKRERWGRGGIWRIPRQPPRRRRWQAGAVVIDSVNTPSPSSTTTHATPPRGRQVDIATDAASLLAESPRAVAHADVRSGGRFVDVAVRNVVQAVNENDRYAGASLKPSDGLEPSTPSLPSLG
jgi:hypothetical protein